MVQFKLMSSTHRQRYFQEERENDIKYKFCGQTRMLQVCLDYEGSQSPLTCTIDGENLKNAAIKAGVKDIVSLYDNGTTQLHPTKENVINQFVAMAGRCIPGDILVFQYSGHGSRKEDEDGDQEDGYDELLCLTTPQGQPDDFVDDQLAKVVCDYIDPSVPCVFLMDCCHSGSLLDLSKPGIWGSGKKVFTISGCQDNQLSGDTGNGGVMTTALLDAIKMKSSKAKRKKRAASIQYIFNRMVEKMPEEQQEEMMMQGDFEEDLNWDFDCEEDFQGQFEWDEGEQFEPQEEQIEEGQTLNLSWNGGADPTRVPFPF